MTSPRHCPECGDALPADAARHREFCNSACKLAFNNRRMQRGAVLYDFFMTHRHDRKQGADLKVFTCMNRLATNWHAEDQARRGGRRSWRPVKRFLRENPWLHAVNFGNMKIGRM